MSKREYLERTLRAAVVDERMEVGETGERGDRFVELRVIFHRARTERIELERLPEVELRETQKMTHHLRLAQFRKAGDVVAAKGRA